MRKGKASYQRVADTGRGEREARKEGGVCLAEEVWFPLGTNVYEGRDRHAISKKRSLTGKNNLDQGKNSRLQAKEREMVSVKGGSCSEGQWGVPSFGGREGFRISCGPSNTSKEQGVIYHNRSWQLSLLSLLSRVP